MQHDAGRGSVPETGQSGHFGRVTTMVMPRSATTAAIRSDWNVNASA